MDDTARSATPDAGSPLPSRQHLTLAWNARASRVIGTKPRQVAEWELRGIAAEGLRPATDILARMLVDLPEGQILQFEHAFQVAGEAPRYELAIRLLDSQSAARDNGATVDAVLRDAFPALWLARCESAPSSDGPAWPLRAVVRPAVARVWPGPETVAMRDAREVQVEQLPLPKLWPTRPLSVALEQASRLPLAFRLVQRMRPLRLSPEAQKTMYSTMQRLLAGAVLCFEPESPLSVFNASPILRHPIAELLQRWLVRPKGWCFDMLIYAEDEMPAGATDRLAEDVFGGTNFEVAGPEAADLPPELARGSLPLQGLPAIWPEPSLARERGVPPHYAAPDSAMAIDGACVGQTAAGERSEPVRLAKAAWTRHSLIMGTNGSGKSFLMARAIAEQAADPSRPCGIGVIDPHGDLAEQVLSLMPRSRMDDVILIDVTDPTHTACINPMQGMRDDPAHAHRVASQMVDIIDSLFESRDSTGPHKRANLKHLLLIEGTRPGVNGTLMGAVRALEEPTYRDWLLRNCPDPSVTGFWRRLMSTSGENGYQNWVPHLHAPLVPWTANPVLKRLLCRPDSTVNLRDAMDQGKVVICNLSKSVLQDAECRAVGSLLLMLFHGAAISRANAPGTERTPFCLYVDEFQSFVGDSVGRMFAEARKFGLGLCVGLQHAGQLANRWGRDRLLDSVLANTGTKFIFRLGPADTDLLAPYYMPAATQREIVRLPDFHAVMSASSGGRPSSPFVIRVNPPEAPVDVADREAVRALARSKMHTIAAANSELIALYDLHPAALRGN